MGKLYDSVRDQNQKTFNIEDLGNLFGISPRTVRRWEKYGLRPEKVKQKGRLVYTKERLLEFIKTEIKEYG